MDIRLAAPGLAIIIYRVVFQQCGDRSVAFIVGSRSRPVEAHAFRAGGLADRSRNACRHKSAILFRRVADIRNMLQPAVADRRYNCLIRVINRNGSGKGNADGFACFLFRCVNPLIVSMCVPACGIVGYLVCKLLISVQLHRLFPGYGSRARPGAHKAGILRIYCYIFDLVYSVIYIVFNVVQIGFGPGIYDIYRHTA